MPEKYEHKKTNKMKKKWQILSHFLLHKLAQQNIVPFQTLFDLKISSFKIGKLR